MLYMITSCFLFPFLINIPYPLVGHEVKENMQGELDVGKKTSVFPFFVTNVYFFMLDSRFVVRGHRSKKMWSGGCVKRSKSRLIIQRNRTKITEHQFDSNLAFPYIL